MSRRRRWPRWPSELGVDLVVVGPRRRWSPASPTPSPRAGISCFGPSREAARLEGSKAFAKEVMAAAGVPTARPVCATPRRSRPRSTPSGRRTSSRTTAWPPARASSSPTDRDAALAHAAACDRVVVEEFLDGPEVSLFALCDGATVVAAAAGPGLQADLRRRRSAQHRRDGLLHATAMGARRPGRRGRRHVVQPTVDEMARRGTPFRGLLFAGLALTPRGPRVIEFNARFGDPETQPLLALLDSPLSAYSSRRSRRQPGRRAAPPGRPAPR